MFVGMPGQTTMSLRGRCLVSRGGVPLAKRGVPGSGPWHRISHRAEEIGPLSLAWLVEVSAELISSAHIHEVFSQRPPSWFLSSANM